MGGTGETCEELYDIIRLDHFRGFEAYWSIPPKTTPLSTASGSKRRARLFSRLREALGELPFIAEDLGVITREVEALREQFGMPEITCNSLSEIAARTTICRTATCPTRSSTPALTTTTPRADGGSTERATMRRQRSRPIFIPDQTAWYGR